MSRRHEDGKRGKAPGKRPQGSKPPTGKGSANRGPVGKGPDRKGAGGRGTGGEGTGDKPASGRPGGKPLVRKPVDGAHGAPAPRGRVSPRRSQRQQQGLRVTPAPSATPPADGKVRLNHFLAQCGVCSRRAADGLIETGRVEVNGKLCSELGTRIDPLHDEVRFDGNLVQPEKPVYVLFNKPKGVVCTNAPHEQKKRVIDFLPTVKGRIFTVGRLDLDSEGLILLTNDGAFALEMTHPRYGVPKLYHVLLRGRVEHEDLGKARGGVWLAEGPTSGMQIRITRTTQDRTYLQVVLREGKNREIRRVFAKLGFPVISLKRVRIGELTLRGLREGKWRFLDRSEVNELRRVARGDGAMTEGKR